MSSIVGIVEYIGINPTIRSGYCSGRRYLKTLTSARAGDKIAAVTKEIKIGICRSIYFMVGPQAMRITGPERYKLSFTPDAFVVECQKGSAKFSGIATSKKPKLYIASVDEEPIYVGVTKQPIRNRLRLGWNAEGESGYYGYAWRHRLTKANLDIWCHEDVPPEKPSLDIETVEAEVVFLIRSASQWPMYQTEIHFHPSTSVHRDVAAAIISRYALRPNTAVNPDAP